MTGSLLRRLPRAACQVVTVEEYKEQDAPPAYYYPPPYYAPATAYPAPASPPMVLQGTPPESPGWQPGQTYCREWQGKAQINGQTQDVHGTICRQPDGTWRFQN